MFSRVRAAAARAAASKRIVNKPIQQVQFRSFHSSPAAVFTRRTTKTLIRNTHAPIRHFAITPVNVPTLGDSITEGTLVKWQKNVGDSVAADDVLLVIETDKVSVDIRAPASGVLKSQSAKEGDTIKVGSELGSIDTDAKGVAPTSTPPPKPASTQVPASTDHIKQAQPQQISTTVPATPPAASPKSTTGPVAPSSKAAPALAAPAKPITPISFPTPGTRGSRRVPMSRMRQTIANRLKNAQNTAACLTTFNEIDMTNLMELRNKHKDEFLEKFGVKLGFMSGFVRAAAISLQKYPDVNAFIEGSDTVYNDFVDISVAVSTPTGLVVPVLRNVEQMGFAQIENAIAALGVKARKGQIAIEDMVGGTFTISNGGVYGSLFGTPILNSPQSAILGMHGIFKRPIVINDKIEIRPMMYVALTYDHRIIDGGAAVTFLKEIKSNVEEPTRLLLGL